MSATSRIATAGGAFRWSIGQRDSEWTACGVKIEEKPAYSPEPPGETKTPTTGGRNLSGERV